MEIDAKHIAKIVTDAVAKETFAERRQLIDAAFREMAISDTSDIDASTMRLLESHIAQVKERRPDLSETDAYIVAGRLLKQLIACYQGALQQLLP
jgi:hypothetical protein